jgi:uncharacterized phage-associated protein
MAANLKKFMQLIVFFAQQESVKPLGKTKLFKLLYFTDVTHLRTVGQAITDAQYLKYPYGPVPVQGEFALKELRKRRFIRIQHLHFPNKQPVWEITALQHPDMTIFTAQEMQTIYSVIQQYGDDTAVTLSWKSHQELAWLITEDWRPLPLASEKHNAEPEDKNTAAIAWVQQWYATPDAQPPGFWEEFEEVLKANPIDFGDMDLES